MPMRCTLLACLPLIVCAATAPDPMLALPKLAKPKPAPADDHGALNEIAPGILIGRGVIVLPGKTLFAQGPSDGLEVLACLDSGKQHESFMKVETKNGAMVNFACLSILGVKEGQCVPREDSGVPARGTPVRVTVEWPDPDQPAVWLAVEASSIVRDRVTDQPQPSLPYVYTGSRMMRIPDTGVDGKPTQVERFMLDTTRSLAVNYDEPDALLASPFPGANADERWEVYSGLPSPPVGTPARLVLRRAELPLTLSSVGEGDQMSAADGANEPLDDATLKARLGETYGADATPALRAVAVLVTPDQPREKDVAIRGRILRVAADAKAWVVPVFVLGEGR